MSQIKLAPVTEKNIKSLFTLEAAADQAGFVASPMKSLAYCSLYETATAYALMHKDQLIGYATILYDPAEKAFVLWHFLVDHRYQGKGLGKASLAAILTEIAKKARGLTQQILLTVEPENTRAQQLYLSFGFHNTQKYDEDGELIFEKSLPL